MTKLLNIDIILKLPVALLEKNHFDKYDMMITITTKSTIKTIFTSSPHLLLVLTMLCMVQEKKTNNN